MAKTDIGPKISVEGEKEYRTQMQNIIAKQKEYAAELKSTTASMDENTSAEQRASSVAAILRKQVAAQTDALNAQKGMLLQATAQYGSASTQATAYRTAVYKTNTELENLRKRLNDAENGLGEFATKADDAKESVQNFGDAQSQSGGLFSGLEKAVVKGNLVASALQQVGSAIVDAGKKTISTGIEYNSQMEQYTVAFTNMLGSAEEANSALAQIKEDAAKTPFDTAGLVKANQLLISTGVDAKDARNVVMALGDAVKATGGGNDELQRMAQNLQQIKNAGKATSADIKQFAYAGIDVYGILSDYTGKSTADVQKLNITYDLLTNALRAASQEGGRYFGAMETQSQTLDGRISTLKDNATQLAGALTEGLASAEGDLVSVATDWVQELSDSLESGGVESMVATGGVLAGNAIDSFTNYATSHMDGVLDTGFGIAENLAIGIVDNAPKLIESAGSITASFIGGVAEKLPDILESGGEITGHIVKGVLNLGSDMLSAGKTLASKAVSGLFSTNWLSVGWDISKGIVQGFINGMKSANFSGMGGGRASAGQGAGRKPSGTNTGGSGDVDPYDGSGGSSGKTSTKKAAQDTKKLAKTVSDTSTQLLQGSKNIIGAISRTTETARNTYNVYDGTTKKIKGTTTETVQTITDSWTEMVDGVEKQFKRIKVLTDGVVTSEKITSSAAQSTAKQSAKTSTQYLTGQQAGIEDAIGYINRSTQTTQKTQKVLDETTGELKDTVVSTTQVVTDCYKRIVDGQEQTIQRSTTYVNGIVTDINEKIADVEAAAKQTVHSRTENLTGSEAGIDEAIGYVNRASQTTQETKKVLDETTGEMVDTVVSSTEVVTDCYKRIVEGQEQTVERTTTYVNGVVTDIQEKTTDLNADIKYTQGVVGGFSKFVLDLDTKLGGLEKAATNLTKSPLGSWFSDLAKGYRASDSFWDNIDPVSLITGGLVSFATGWATTGSWQVGLAKAGLSIVGNLVGVSLDGLVNESNNYGMDFVKGLGEGMQKALPWLVDAAGKVATSISKFLHFSRPDVGPLHEYESWMPDMIDGMADGIRSNAYRLQEAAASLSGQLQTQLQYDVGSANSILQAATNVRRVEFGSVQVSVHAAPGQSAREIAQAVAYELQNLIDQEGASSGEVPVF